MVFKGQDAWRQHPMFVGNFWKMAPGLGTAIVIFAVYNVLEAGYMRMTGK